MDFLSSSLTFISIIATLIAIIVAINVAYNFFSIHDFRTKLEKMQQEFNNEFTILHQNVNSRCENLESDMACKLSSIQKEIEKFREMNIVYAQLMYEVNNANAKFKFNDNCIFETIIEELKNIYHVTSHKDCFTNGKFKEIIAAKYWFIANDIINFNKDKYIECKDDGERNKLLSQRDEIIRLCELIQHHKDATDITEKLTPIFFVVRNLIDDIYYRHPVNQVGQNWDTVRKLAK